MTYTSRIYTHNHITQSINKDAQMKNVSCPVFLCTWKLWNMEIMLVPMIGFLTAHAHLPFSFSLTVYSCYSLSDNKFNIHIECNYNWIKSLLSFLSFCHKTVIMLCKQHISIHLIHFNVICVALVAMDIAAKQLYSIVKVQDFNDSTQIMCLKPIWESVHSHSWVFREYNL